MSRQLKQKLMGLALALATLLLCTSALAQTGGVTGKVTGQGGAPMVGYTIQIDRVDIKWSSHVKTNKKGEYIYIGLVPGNYRVTLVGPDAKPIHYEERTLGVGDPTEINFDMGKLQKEAEKAAESNPEFQKQVEAQKENASLKQIFDQGLELYKQKHYAEAAALYEKALPLAKDRNVGIILGQLADTWERAANAETDRDKKKQEQATSLDYYNKVMAIAPNDATLHNNLGHLYGEMGRTEDAMAEFKKAAELDPNHAANYYYNLGAILVNTGKMDDAAAALKKSTDLDPNSSLAWYWYGMALMGKATVKPDGTMVPAPGTIEAFQTYLKLEPNGKHAPEAQASIDSLSGKADLEYKKSKKK
jgi:tetratricopeptide (TPR) repeat protein